MEQNPLDWWKCVCDRTQEILQGIDKKAIAAITFGGQMMGCTCIDKNGNPLRNSIIWADGRSKKQMEQLAAAYGEKELYYTSGHRESPYYSLTKFMWVKENQPEIYQNTYKTLNCKDFILDVAKNANITPLLTTTDIPGLHYWSEDGSFSFLASMISDDQDPTSKLNIRNVFGLKPFVNTTLMLKELQEAGAIGTNPDEKNFGVGVIKGDAKAVKEYKDKYYIKVLEKPRATTDDVFESMFAVSTYTKDVSRSMEILKLLNTDTEFRTILQYGVKGVNWTEETDPETKETVLKVLNNDYIMNIVDTGNVFITYPGDGLPMSYWDDYRQQNLDSLLYPLIKFQDYIDDDNKEYFDEMKSYSGR